MGGLVSDQPHLSFPCFFPGFRARADLLPPVVFRCGILAALLAHSEQKKERRERNNNNGSRPSSKGNGVAVGCMLTASHNPIEDNGLKLVGPDGCLLSPVWEQRAERLINASFDSSFSSVESARHGREFCGEPSRAEVGDGFCNGADTEVLGEQKDGNSYTSPVPLQPMGHPGEVRTRGEREGDQKATGPRAKAADVEGQSTREQGTQTKETRESLAQKEAEVFMEMIEGVLGKEYLADGEDPTPTKTSSETAASQRPCVIVGRDNRPSSGELEKAFISGVRILGVRVIRVGEVTTGQLQFVVRRWNEKRRTDLQVDALTVDTESEKGEGWVETEKASKAGDEKLTAKERLLREGGGARGDGERESTAVEREVEEAEEEEEEDDRPDDEGAELIEDYYAYFEENFRSFMQQGRHLKQREESGEAFRGEGGGTLDQAGKRHEILLHIRSRLRSSARKLVHEGEAHEGLGGSWSSTQAVGLTDSGEERQKSQGWGRS